MTRFSVWGPLANTIALRVDGRDLPMTSTSDGWWVLETAVPPGTDYAFLVDGREPAVPDPRSGWQPAGVHGPSRLVDQAAFTWHDHGFRAPPLSAAVIYELHVGTFSPEGTFDGAIPHLDHLVRLGVTHVELMPVNAFPGEHGWGYDGVDLFAPHQAYGGPDGLKQLVDACHTRGLGVLLDVVYNHLGPDGNYLERFGPYTTTTHTSPWGAAVNFDAADSDEVRRFVCDNALMWLRDYHLDGLRLDAVHAIVDTSARHILEQLADEVDELEAATGRPYVLVAESNRNDPRLVRSREAGGYGLDAEWSDDVHHALHALLARERTGYYADFGDLTDVATAFREGYVYAGRRSGHRRRIHGRPPVGLPGWRFVACLQNHDQVGNRARGERIAAIAGLGRAKVGAALVMTGPFIPLLFQGEEWAASSPFPYFSDHRDPALAEAVRSGRRREFAAFGWNPDEVPDPQDPATFRAAKLAWAERDRSPHAAMLDWYRRLIALRRSRPDLTDGRLDRVAVTIDTAAEAFLMQRGQIAVVANLGRSEFTTAADAPHLLLASDPAVRVERSRIAVPPDAVAIVARDGPTGRPGVT